MQLLTGIILVLVILAVFFVIIIGTIYVKQEGFFFYPTKLSPNYPYSQFDNKKELFYDTINDGRINALLFSSNSQPKGLVIYSHGNSRSLDDWAWVHQDFVKLGYDILIYDYRTFGKSEGELNEANLYSDIRHIMNEMSKSYPMKDIVIYGRSLGAAMATQMATEFAAKCLILETPFSSMLSMAHASVPFIPVKYVLRYKFNNKRKMKSLKCPIHILHGTTDELIPLRHAKKLFKANGNPDSSLTIIEGGTHNNLSQFDIYHETLREILV